jgi:hypothetical protein
MIDQARQKNWEAVSNSEKINDLDVNKQRGTGAWLGVLFEWAGGY